MDRVSEEVILKELTDIVAKGSRELASYVGFDKSKHTKDDLKEMLSIFKDYFRSWNVLATRFIVNRYNEKDYPLKKEAFIGTIKIQVSVIFGEFDTDLFREIESEFKKEFK